MARKNQTQDTTSTSVETSLADSVRLLQEEMADVRVTTVTKRQHDDLAAVVADLRSICLNIQESLAHQKHPAPDKPSYHVHSPSNSTNFHPIFQQNTSGSQIKPPKVTLSPFDGNNPLDWGTALGWYHWMENNEQITTWDNFVRDLLLRFGPSSYDNMQATLFKLRQMGSVLEYQQRFETISNLVKGLSTEALLNCFISGLKPDLRAELAILKPTTVSQAIDLAKLVETKLSDNRMRLPYRTPPSSTPPLLPTPPVAQPKTQLPIRRLTPAEMHTRRLKGLCFNCDDKYSPGHKCKSPQFLALLVDEESAPPSTWLENEETALQPEDEPPMPTARLLQQSSESEVQYQLSLAAYMGLSSKRTLRYT
ncbi:hypothetical protein OROGR_001898 [Orobanche gracilis]